MDNFFDIFLNLEDTRDTRGKKHRLIDVIVLSIYGMLCGFTDFYNMAYFLKKKEPYFTNLLGLINGIPSHDTFSLVFRTINSKHFMELFIGWTKKIASVKNKHIAIDGKAIKAATNKVSGANTPYIVSGFLTGIGLSIGQVKVNEKSNEITAIPDLLDLIDITDATITIDAIGTQKNIVEKIIEKKGHYCLSVKENQKLMYQDINDYFKDDALKYKEENEKLSKYTTKEKNHGRIEKREYFVIDDVSFIYDRDSWKNLANVGMVRQSRTINNETTTEVHYHILDTKVSAKEYAEITRSHWEIENKLHWILDVQFKEDFSTAKKDYAIENLALLRKIVFNLTKLDATMNGKSVRTKTTDYLIDFNNIELLIFEVIPSNN